MKTSLRESCAGNRVSISKQQARPACANCRIRRCWLSPRQENRILVTHDRRTMPRHFADFIVNQRSPGVLIIAQKVSVSVAIEELLLIWAASDTEEWINLIVDLPL